MKYILAVFSYIVLTSVTAHAATLSLSHEYDSQNRIKLIVSLDPLEQSINAVSGTVSFPKEYFELDSIETIDSVVPLWLERPAVSKALDFSGLAHIHFEGTIPGGFSGIRSPYYEGGKPGLLFTALLKVKKPGNTVAILDEARLYLNDGNATPISIETTPHEISLSAVTQKSVEAAQVKVTNESFKPYITKSDLVASGAWTLIIQDDETKRSVDHYEVAESKEYFSENLASYEWRTVHTPYVLNYQTRNRFIHVKAVYADDSYAVITLPPVENIDHTSNTSSILVLISILLIGLYAIRKHMGTEKRHASKRS